MYFSLSKNTNISSDYLHSTNVRIGQILHKISFCDYKKILKSNFSSRAKFYRYNVSFEFKKFQ